MQKSRENTKKPQSAQSISSIKKTQSILLIDDSSENLELNKILLELEGYEVFTAEGGKEALIVLSEISEPNLILLDMQMSEMNGAEFLTLLEEKMPEIVKDVPIVFMTGMDEIPKSKASGVIHKPTDKNTFIMTVRKYIALGIQSHYRH